LLGAEGSNESERESIACHAGSVAVTASLDRDANGRAASWTDSGLRYKGVGGIYIVDSAHKLRF